MRSEVPHMASIQPVRAPQALLRCEALTALVVGLFLRSSGRRHRGSLCIWVKMEMSGAERTYRRLDGREAKSDRGSHSSSSRAQLSSVAFKMSNHDPSDFRRSNFRNHSLWNISIALSRNLSFSCAHSRIYGNCISLRHCSPPSCAV